MEVSCVNIGVCFLSAPQVGPLWRSSQPDFEDFESLFLPFFDPQVRRLAIAFSTALMRSRASSFKSRRET